MEWAFGGLFAIFGLLFVAGFVLWVWALIDCVRVPDDSMFQSGNKLIWVLIIVFTQIIGAVLYLLIGRPRADAAPGSPPRASSPANGPPSMPPPPA
jgi:hypothetical protein